MRYATAQVFGVLVSASTAFGCTFDEWDGIGSYSENEIIFGISQSTNAEGKRTTTVGYELLDLQNKGWNARGLVTRDASCWAENLDGRLGKPRVEGGVAIFKGALLPAEGIAVVANRQDDLTLDAPAWERAGDSMVFEARGFAMPTISPARVLLPSTTLDVVTPPAPSSELQLSAATELEIGWNTADGVGTSPRENVIASLKAPAAGATDGRGAELRCFFDRRAGAGRFPKAVMDRFLTLVGGTGPVQGELRIATHRQLTIFARGGWTVYVVASVEQREQPFVLVR